MLTKTTSRAILFVLLLTMLFYCLDYYFRISPSLVLPQLMRQYHTDALGIGGFASAFYLGYLLMQIPSGYIMDQLPLNRVLIISILFCTACFIGFIFANHYWMGWLLRFLVGAASAFSFISVLFIARHFLPRHYFNFIAGLTIALGTLSAAAAQVITAVFTKYVDWHWVIFILALWGFIVAFFLAMKFSRLSKPEVKVLNLKDTLSALYSLLKTNRFVLNGVIGCLLYLPTSLIATVWGISFMRQSYHMSSTSASSAIFMLFLGWAIGSPFIGALADRIRYYRLLLMVFSGLAAITAWLFILVLTQHVLLVDVLMLLFGLFSSSQVLVWRVFHLICPVEKSGLGVGLTNMIIMLGGTIFHLVLGWLMSSKTPGFQIDFHAGMWLVPIIILFAMGLSVFL